MANYNETFRAKGACNCRKQMVIKQKNLYSYHHQSLHAYVIHSRFTISKGIFTKWMPTSTWYNRNETVFSAYLTSCTVLVYPEIHASAIEQELRAPSNQSICKSASSIRNFLSNCFFMNFVFAIDESFVNNFPNLLQICRMWNSTKSTDIGTILVVGREAFYKYISDISVTLFLTLSLNLFLVGMYFPLCIIDWTHWCRVTHTHTYIYAMTKIFLLFLPK